MKTYSSNSSSSSRKVKLIFQTTQCVIVDELKYNYCYDHCDPPCYVFHYLDRELKVCLHLHLILL